MLFSNAVFISIICTTINISFGNDFELHLPPKLLKVCDNAIVRDIPGGAAAVLEAGKAYVESMINLTNNPFPPFDGRWKHEVTRLNLPQVPECKHLKVIGDEHKNYDEAKRFCYDENDVRNAVGGGCVAYSIGSNNQWHFEEHVFSQTNCSTVTFDCTCNVTIPEEIVSRTVFHPVCLSAVHSIDHNGHKFLTLPQINKVAGRENGPDYFKMDIEGYEWNMLHTLVRQADANHELHHHLPLQIYAEYHLDRDSLDDNTYLKGTAHTGMRLRRFFDDMFAKGGYMIMHIRPTVQTRNTDILLTKVFCPVD